MSTYDYHLFAKMKEPLQGTRYNTREIIHAVGRSLLGINRSGRANDVQYLPQIWKKVVHMEAIILKECVFTSVIKSFWNYRDVATTFYPTLVL
jgi:hypothetical protein